MKINTTISSKNLLIEDLSKKDFNQKYLNWLKDEKITRFLDQDKNYNDLTLEDCLNLLNTLQDSSNNFFLKIINKSNKQHIGNIRVGEIYWEEKISEIAILIGEKQYWGLGYGSEAIELLTNFYFKKFPIDFFLAGLMIKNISSRKLFNKCNFKTYKNLNKFSLNQKKIIKLIKNKLKSDEILTIKER